MGWYKADTYNQPEEFGLTVIGELYDPEADWSFDNLVVWQHEDGRLFFATDAGCSCPSPFEDHTSLESLTEITSDTWNEFQKHVEGHAVPYDWFNDVYKTDPQTASKTEPLAKVSRLLNASI